MLRQPIEQAHARKSAGQREEPGRDHPIPEQADERTEQRQVQRAVLIRLDEAVPEMRRARPSFRQLDTHRRIAVMFEAEKKRQHARRQSEREHPAQLHFGRLQVPEVSFVQAPFICISQLSEIEPSFALVKVCR